MSTPKSNVTMPYDFKVKGYSIDNGGGEGGASSLAQLNDVTITSPQDGDALVYDAANSKWVNGAGGGGGGVKEETIFSGTFTIEDNYADLGNSIIIPDFLSEFTVIINGETMTDEVSYSVHEGVPTYIFYLDGNDKIYFAPAGSSAIAGELYTETLTGDVEITIKGKTGIDYVLIPYQGCGDGSGITSPLAVAIYKDQETIPVDVLIMSYLLNQGKTVRLAIDNGIYATSIGSIAATGAGVFAFQFIFNIIDLNNPQAITLTPIAAGVYMGGDQ